MNINSKIIFFIISLLALITGCSSDSWKLTGVKQALQTHGGSGLGETSYSCPEQHVLAGITVNSSNFLNSITFLCRPFNEDGSIGTETVSGEKLGGIGGSSSGEKLCGENKMVNGYSGRSGSWLDKIGFHCGTISEVAEGTSSEALGEWGGNGGGSFGDDPIYCPASHVITGAKITPFGTYVGKLQFICSKIEKV